MNELFKEGDYVLLSDCEAFDEKYDLEVGTTMWAVARKMEGGEPSYIYMIVPSDVICVGIYGNDVGAWGDLVSEDSATQLTVEDVLYRSEDGLTLDELSEIQGAFEIGKKYECVEGSCPSVCSINQTYSTNGKGIKVNGSGSCSIGGSSKFKLVTTKPWVPSVGDEVIVHNDNDFELSYGTECLGKKVTVMSVFIDDGVTVAAINYEDVNYCFVLSMLKLIDKERECVIDKAFTIVPPHIFETKAVIGHLYDAGMLKEADK